MNDQEARDEREAMALHLWDEGLVRPEGLAFQVVDAFLAAGYRKRPEPEWEYGYSLDRAMRRRVGLWVPVEEGEQ